MINLACLSRDIVSAEEVRRHSTSTTPTSSILPDSHPDYKDSSRDTIHTASPELVAQVSHLEALLSSQQTELNDLVETDSNVPGQEEEEEDDDLAAELADLAESRTTERTGTTAACQFQLTVRGGQTFSRMLASRLGFV
jgi:hypothetical protein